MPKLVNSDVAVVAAIDTYKPRESKAAKEDTDLSSFLSWS